MKTLRILALSFALVPLAPARADDAVATAVIPAGKAPHSVGIGVGGDSDSAKLSVEGAIQGPKLEILPKSSDPSGGTIISLDPSSSGSLTIDPQKGEIVGGEAQVGHAIAITAGQDSDGVAGAIGLQGTLSAGHDPATGISHAGPEIGSTMDVFFPLDDYGDYMCLYAPVLAVPSGVTAAKVSDKAGWGAEFKYDLGACAHVKTPIGQLDAKAGVTFGVSFPAAADADDGSYTSKVYGDATLTEIGGSPMMAGVSLSHSSISPSGEAHKSVTEGIGTVGFAW
ncbi:MAG TPA: hypothetical protein VL588_07605 [Bdellovibrionota bacterium]|nr:hypothetical protein [Bdellovibrionota bacterium]